MPARRTRTQTVKPETIAAIKAHYGTVARAYEGLQVQDRMSLPEFYRVMQGGECAPAVAVDIAYAWGAGACRQSGWGPPWRPLSASWAPTPSDTQAAVVMRRWLKEHE